MVRTQVYLTEEERERLAALATATGRPQSELIREALDRFLDQAGASHRERVLRRAAGAWGNRSDLPNFREFRDGWDRS